MRGAITSGFGWLWWNIGYIAPQGHRITILIAHINPGPRVATNHDEVNRQEPVWIVDICSCWSELKLRGRVQTCAAHMREDGVSMAEQQKK